MQNFHLVVLSVGVALLLCAALHDIVARTVPNWLAGLVAAAGLVTQVAQGTILVGALSATIVFVIAALAWRRGWMGGGDVKLLGAVALLVPPDAVPGMVMATALAGGLLAVVYLVARRRLARPGCPKPGSLLARALRAERWRLRRGGPMPYAVAIACGAIFVLSHGVLP